MSTVRSTHSAPEDGSTQSNEAASGRQREARLIEGEFGIPSRVPARNFAAAGIYSAWIYRNRHVAVQHLSGRRTVVSCIGLAAAGLEPHNRHAASWVMLAEAESHERGTQLALKAEGRAAERCICAAPDSS